MVFAFVSQLFGTKTPPFTLTRLSETELESNVKDKSFLIVGGTKGIGAALAQSLVQRGANVVVTGRSRSEETPENVEFIESDVSSMVNAKELVQTKLKGREFDTVVMTVGIITRSTLTKTNEGIEEDLAISYLSRFIILNELIRAGSLVGRKRIFIMGFPGEKKLEPVNIEDLNFDETPYKQMGAHMNTVVLNEAMVYELAKRYPELRVFGLNPGLIQTHIRDNFHGGDKSILGRIVEKVIGWTNMDTKTYAERALIHFMASPSLDSKSPTSFNRELEELTPGNWVSDPSNREKAWQQSQKLISKVLKDIQSY